MQLLTTDIHVDFLDDGRQAGRYWHTDPFKPFVHPLRTPAGHSVSLASPHDHKHHKGLMLGLRTPEVNFWEERLSPETSLPGRQRHLRFSDLADDGEAVGFQQHLLWEGSDGTLPTFEETRRLHCRRGETAFEWTWHSRLAALRDCELVLSQWAVARPDGVKVNYHGLGLRLPRSFSMCAQLRVDGQKATFEEAMGRRARRVTYAGSLDPEYPHWPGPRLAVTIEQTQDFPLFILKQPFGYISLGPSNLAPVALRKGQVIEAGFKITVADLPAE